MKPQTIAAYGHVVPFATNDGRWKHVLAERADVVNSLAIGTDQLLNGVALLARLAVNESH